MRRKLGYLDLRIIESLTIHGPRNLASVARKLDISSGRLRKRLKRLHSNIFLRFATNIYHTYLGLKKAVVFAEAEPGYEELLFKGLKTNDFWIFVSRCYGMNEGCFGIYTIPRGHENDFEQFYEELQKTGVARAVQVLWSTCFHSVNSICSWFEPESRNWDFHWNKWVEEVTIEETELPSTLVDPEEWPVKADEIDVFILKELEKDARISFVDLAKKLGVSPQLVGYHYRNHLEKRGLIESFNVSLYYFERAISDLLFFIFEFDDGENLAKFASSLLDKPFVRGLGKILRENALLGYIYLPRVEFANFINSLAKLIKMGHLKSYRYIIQHLRKASRQTISYEYFKAGSWIYDHQKHIENLHNMVRESVRGRNLEKLVDV